MPIEAVRRENADVLYVMPSHQFPLGTVMPFKTAVGVFGNGHRRKKADI